MKLFAGAWRVEAEPHALALGLEVGVGERLRQRCVIENMPVAGGIAELTTSKDALSAAAFDALDRRIRSLLSALLGDAGITHNGVADMFLAAGKGTLYTGDDTEQPYRARLTAMIDTLVAGLQFQTRNRNKSR